MSDLSGFSLAELFKMEVESQSATLTEGLLAIEQDPTALHWLESLMRAAHSLKGAARIVDRELAVRMMHEMEDFFVAAQNGQATLSPARIDILLQGVDLLTRLSQVPDAQIPDWDAANKGEVDEFLKKLASHIEPVVERPAGVEEAPTAIVEEVEVEPYATEPEVEPEPEVELEVEPEPVAIPEVEIETVPEPVAKVIPPPPVPVSPPVVPVVSIAPIPPAPPEPAPVIKENRAAETARDASNRALKVSSDNLNRLMGLAGELIVASRWSEGFAADLMRLKKMQRELATSINAMRDLLPDGEGELRDKWADVQQRQAQCQEFLGEQLGVVDEFDRRFVNLSSRLYDQVLETRMRPFADGIGSFSRMVRDVARDLGKDARLEIIGENTAVDRDILERIEAPLRHLLRNSIDHGLESTATRRELGKSETAIIRLEAAHSHGMLLITVADDGGGIDVEKIRQAVVRKRLSSAEVAQTMSDAELLEFLFLPGFSMKEGVVTEISGRGVGLDVVQTIAREVGGMVRVTAQPGVGTQFQLQLPLTLSVMRTLLVEISGEPYAFPLARLVGAVKVAREEIETVQGRQHFQFGGQRIGLVTAQQILGLDGSSAQSEVLSVIVIGTKAARYGLAIDQFLREQELVVQPLDARLGKVKDISAAALMPDRTPVLIVDVEDLTRSIEDLVSSGSVATVQRGNTASVARNKRVLVVDDSLTVRELERKLLDGRGYEVDVAVDGIDGWNKARAGQYDLVITDVDMPRMDGIELVRLLKQDARLGSLPVMIVSYKDREEDRRRGLEAGADYYLTKGSFHDESLLDAVTDLIGEAVE